MLWKQFAWKQTLCVFNRIQSLHESFRKELKKVQNLKKSGPSSDSVHVLSLWYYDLFVTRDLEEIISDVEESEEWKGYRPLEVGYESQPCTLTGQEKEQVEVSLSKQFIMYQ